jgi:hypothetical protein
MNSYISNVIENTLVNKKETPNDLRPWTGAGAGVRLDRLDNQTLPGSRKKLEASLSW